MNFFYKNRSQEDKDFISLVCNDILSQPLEEKSYSDDFAFVFIDGRPNVDFNTLEHNAMFRSCRLFSKFKYPIFCFVNNPASLLNSISPADYNLVIIQISELNSLEQYSRFMIEKLFFLLPENIKNIITIQADGFLLKSGVEDYVLDGGWSFIGAHWCHLANMDFKNGNKWHLIGNNHVYGFNGGFSYRNADKCRYLSKKYAGFVCRERNAPNDKYPQEDLWYSVMMQPNSKLPTLREADLFSKDPLTLKIYNDKNNLPFGFHYFRPVAEFPECNHE